MEDLFSVIKKASIRVIIVNNTAIVNGVGNTDLNAFSDYDEGYNIASVLLKDNQFQSVKMDISEYRFIPYLIIVTSWDINIIRDISVKTDKNPW